MRSVLDSLKSFNEDTFILKTHPLRTLDQESKLTYLAGLALVMNADSKMLRSESKYIATLIRTFGLPDSLLVELKMDALFIDNAFIEKLKVTLLRKNLVNTFLYDAVMVCYRDGDYCKVENEVLEEICLLVDFPESDMLFVENVIRAITTKDLRTLEIIGKEKREQWEYLLEYIGIAYSTEFITECSTGELDYQLS